MTFTGFGSSTCRNRPDDAIIMYTQSHPGRPGICAANLLREGNIAAQG